MRVAKTRLIQKEYNTTELKKNPLHTLTTIKMTALEIYCWKTVKTKFSITVNFNFSIS